MYPTVPLLVNSVSNELNQVWANLIENFIEAMLGQGELRFHIFREDRNPQWLKLAITALESLLR